MEANPEDTTERGSNPLGTIAATAVVFGLVAWFFITREFGLFVTIGGIVLGFVARYRARSQYLRTGLATLAIGGGILTLALYGLILFGESIWPV